MVHVNIKLPIPIQMRHNLQWGLFLTYILNAIPQIHTSIFSPILLFKHCTFYIFWIYALPFGLSWLPSFVKFHYRYVLTLGLYIDKYRRPFLAFIYIYIYLSLEKEHSENRWWVFGNIFLLIDWLHHVFFLLEH